MSTLAVLLLVFVAFWVGGELGRRAAFRSIRDYLENAPTAAQVGAWKRSAKAGRR